MFATCVLKVGFTKYKTYSDSKDPIYWILRSTSLEFLLGRNIGTFFQSNILLLHVDEHCPLAAFYTNNLVFWRRF